MSRTRPERAEPVDLASLRPALARGIGWISLDMMRFRTEPETRERFDGLAKHP